MTQCDRCEQDATLRMFFKGKNGTIVANVCEDCGNYMKKLGWVAKAIIEPSLSSSSQKANLKTTRMIDYAEIAKRNKASQSYWGGK